MEPFRSGIIEGPCFDNKLKGQRQTGDRLEPNDTTLEATPLGTSDEYYTTDIDFISSVKSCDCDHKRIDRGARFEVTVSVTSLSMSNLEGLQDGTQGQPSGCCVGTTFD